MTEARVAVVEVWVDEWKIQRRTQQYQLVSCFILLINIYILVNVGTRVAVIHCFFDIFISYHICLSGWAENLTWVCLSDLQLATGATTRTHAAWEIISLGLVWPLRCPCWWISSVQTLWTQNGCQRMKYIRYVLPPWRTKYFYTVVLVLLLKKRMWIIYPLLLCRNPSFL